MGQATEMLLVQIGADGLAAYQEQVPAGYVAEYNRLGEDPLCYGFGETKEAAFYAARSQVSGVDRSMQSRLMSRVSLHPVSAERASEILEMLATPW